MPSYNPKVCYWSTIPPHIYSLSHVGGECNILINEKSPHSLGGLEFLGAPLEGL